LAVAKGSAHTHVFRSLSLEVVMVELLMYPSALLRHLSGLAVLGAHVGAYLHSSKFPP
jgi:hypothetical protein